MIFDFKVPEDFAKSSPVTNLSLPTFADGTKANGLVVHCCCAPCCTSILECLIFNNIRPLMFFYNPNIYPQEEYEKRRDEWVRLCNELDLQYVIGDYDYQKWLNYIKGLELEPERGGRCQKCFNTRLLVTAAFAKENNINCFTSTLATSRWKNKKQIDSAGFAAQNCVEGVYYWDQDWRKNGLIDRRNILVKEFAFYNQQYCGCEFSLRKDEYNK